MKPSVTELLAVLDKETDCYTKMLTVLAEEEQAIGLTGRDRFDRVQEEKESLVVHIGKLESLRRSLVAQLSPSRQDSEPPITVRKLARLLDPPYNRKLLDRAGRLRSVIEDVRTKNRRNQSLIHQYLSLTKESLRLLTNVIDNSPTYQKPGVRTSLSNSRPGTGRVIRGSV